MERLDPYIKANPKGQWEDWITAAYFDRVGLSVAGFYKYELFSYKTCFQLYSTENAIVCRTPGIGFNFKEKTGKPFNYFCFGAACAEVEIDCLTGDHEVSRNERVCFKMGKKLINTNSGPSL